MPRYRNSKQDKDQNPYKVNQAAPSPFKSFIDFNTQRVCPSCGKAIKISHNFCKFCGVDLSAIEAIGNSDEISKQLAITAATDPDPGVRKEAVDTLGDFGEKKVLGVLTYVLLNDPNEEVRKEAADELGDLHHPYSMEVLAKALKDESPMVRKEAIEGLKKIKRKVKPEKQSKGKPEERAEDEAKDEVKNDTEDDTKDETENGIKDETED
ncbi:MAG: HEAT repeat domain-containing protein [Candidatus Lokiarchaeota archaeon]|nr:HEAT repeat domain-containing protein [Candidatus Lokiarchaeota archaeon]